MRPVKSLTRWRALGAVPDIRDGRRESRLARNAGRVEGSVMSLRLEMLQVARLAPAVLGENASRRIGGFVLRQRHPEGGFCDREGRSDLYYTSFAVDCLTALQMPLPDQELAAWLGGFGDGEGLDFVHRCCLARLWSAVSRHQDGATGHGAMIERILAGIERWRTPEGGYHPRLGRDHGTAYGCLLGYGAWADHGKKPPQAGGLGRCLDGLRSADGVWSNEVGRPHGLATATAAAVTLARNLRQPIPPAVGQWLLGCWHPGGGFVPFPGAPIPDLLSTAVVLHALDGLQQDFAAVKEPCLDFVDTLWNAEGGFHGHWADDALDVEYSYYGLLALGHLSL